ncbi:MAG: hypothetical protein MUW51_11455 [Lactococcus lactis]|nr:hypothetical protein [Lactococcus lactis]
MPSGKVERIERTPGFTQIDNKLLTDKSLGLEGIGLMSHLLHYSKTFEVYKSVLHREWGRATVEKAWKKRPKQVISLHSKIILQTALKIHIIIHLMNLNFSILI